MKTKTLFVTLFAVTAFICLAGRASAQVSPAGDKLRIGDTFELRIGGVPSDDISTISSSYTIDGEGYLNISYLGKIKIVGMTTSQVQSTVERAYVNGGIFTHPTVTLATSAARFVNVSGAVKNPTRIPYTPDMTVMSAINAAGDFNDYADRKHVKLTHGNEVKTINANKARQDPNEDAKVLPGDSIFVRESIFG